MEKVLPVKNEDGAIVNPMNLHVDAVVGKEIICPVCANFEYSTWPYGWDAHAGHRCKALRGNDPEKRKDEYKGITAHLFRKMSANNLLYDAGNVGGLLKHGLLAELLRWHGEVSDAIIFLDPFGGFPVHCVSPLVIERVQKLRNSALLDIQVEIAKGCYYGSSFLARRAIKNAPNQADKVFVSDHKKETRQLLLAYGLQELKRDRFNARDGYSILDCAREGEVVLIDPFGDFLPREVKADDTKKIIPKIARVSKYATVILFVLNLNPENSVGKKYQKLKEKHLRDAWFLSCPPIKNVGVRGESKYHVEVLLASPWLQAPSAKNLHRELQCYTTTLAKILHTEVRLFPHELP